MAKRILFVEDQGSDRERLRRLLAGQEHELVEVNNGAEGFAIFRQAAFDLVILDLDLPFIRGDELALLIRQMIPTQPILMLANRPYKISPDNPVDVFLHKACDPKRLLHEIRSLLERSELEPAEPDWSPLPVAGTVEAF